MEDHLVRYSHKGEGSFMVKIQLLKDGKEPFRATEGAAGYDLFAAIGDYNMIMLRPGKKVIVPTGIKVALPPDMVMDIRPRSGLANKHKVTVLNAPGTIDSDYRGEIGVILINHGDSDFYINNGDRIAQAVFIKVEAPTFEVVDSLGETERGEGGFGSTGGVLED